ncbi:hypothetical protein TNCV_23511 [Trichonephila clavipes]|nr:hypothetical protein TNCV_23511 [Trichonephila clavipes]
MCKPAIDLNDLEIKVMYVKWSSSYMDMIQFEKDNTGHFLIEGEEFRKFEKKKLSLQEAFDLLHNLPSEISDVLTQDFSDEEVLENNLLEFSLDS